MKKANSNINKNSPFLGENRVFFQLEAKKRKEKATNKTNKKQTRRV